MIVVFLYLILSFFKISRTFFTGYIVKSLFTIDKADYDVFIYSYLFFY